MCLLDISIGCGLDGATRHNAMQPKFPWSTPLRLRDNQRRCPRNHNFPTSRPDPLLASFWESRRSRTDALFFTQQVEAKNTVEGMQSGGRRQVLVLHADGVCDSRRFSVSSQWSWRRTQELYCRQRWFWHVSESKWLGVIVLNPICCSITRQCIYLRT